MSTEVKVGQVWRDKDKRRNTVIEIIDTFKSDAWGLMALGLVVGIEEEREYRVDRLVKRWELVQDKPLTPLEKDVAKIVKEEPKKVVHRKKAPGSRTKVKPIHETREQWLNEAVLLLGERVFGKHKVPFIRVSVGWPRRAREATIGQCFVSKVSADKSSQIFISPKLSDVTASQGVLATLVHEMVHAIDDCENGHKARFKSIATEVGLEGKMTATHAGEDLTETLKEIAEELGVYPHAAISVDAKPVVQKTYMLKVVSKSEPDYKLRMTQKMIDEYGLPRDPWGEEMEVEDA